MINFKNLKKYCCEDFSLIENYDKASKDLLEVWDIHHLKEEEGLVTVRRKSNKIYEKLIKTNSYKYIVVSDYL